MADTTSVITKAGGGTAAYVTGKEIFVDLSAQAGVSFAMTTAHIGKTILLYSSVEGQSYKLLAANNALLATGKGIGFKALPGSKPIRIFNGGTAGTDPILEAYLLPGADVALFLTSTTVPSVNAGTWKARGSGLFHGPVPVTMPNVPDAGVDAGSVLLAASVQFTNTLIPNISLTRLSSTLYVGSFIPAAGTSIVCYAVSYNHATDAWTWGSPVTSFSSANQWSSIGVVGLSATTFAVLAWEATANKVSARACTVAGTTITQGTTIQSGAWGVNPSDIHCGDQFCLVPDSATTFFYACSYDNAHLGILHFSVVGTTLTQDGGSTFANSSTASSVQLGGYSPSANNLDLCISSNLATNGSGVSRYNYAGGAVTNTWDRRNKDTIGQMLVLQSADPTARVYYTWSSSALQRLVMNAGFTDFTEHSDTIVPTTSRAGASVAAQRLFFLSDSEALVYDSAGIGSLSLFDPAIAIRHREQVLSNTSSDLGASQHILAAPNLVPQITLAGRQLGFDINPTIRRAAAYYSDQSQTLAIGRQLRMQMYDLPRNYDQVMQ